MHSNSFVVMICFMQINIKTPPVSSKPKARYSVGDTITPMLTDNVSPLPSRRLRPISSPQTHHHPLQGSLSTSPLRGRRMIRVSNYII